MRLFLGSFLSPANQDFFDAAISDLVGRHPDVLRAIPRRSAHLTYAFCADAHDETADAIQAAIRPVAERHAVINLGLGGLRLISAGPVPRLIASDVEAGAEALRGLTADLSETCRRTFPALEWKPSREPHVTLVRFRKHAGRRDRELVERTLRSVETAHPSWSDRIENVHVIQSVLTPAGPAYTSLASVRL